MDSDGGGARQPDATPPHLPGISRGRGSPVIFLPGWSMSHARPSGVALGVESALIAPLARHHQVRWLGRRRGVPAGFSIADFAADVAACLRGRFTGPVPVVGFSTGGFVALQLAIDHPGVVGPLVVVGAGSRLTEVARQEELHLAELLECGDPRQAWRALAGEAVGRPLARAVAPALHRWGPLKSATDCRDAAATCRADLAFDVSAELTTITSPTLLVVGRNDSACDPGLAVATRDAIPDAELLLLPSTGHVGSLVRPRATAGIRTFLTRTRSVAG